MNLSPSKIYSVYEGILSGGPSLVVLIFADGNWKSLKGESAASFSWLWEIVVLSVISEFDHWLSSFTWSSPGVLWSTSVIVI